MPESLGGCGGGGGDGDGLGEDEGVGVLMTGLGLSEEGLVIVGGADVVLNHCKVPQN